MTLGGLCKSSLNSDDLDKNLKESTRLQSDPYALLFKSYRIEDICLQVSAYSVSCSQLKSQIANEIPEALSLAKNKISQIEILESSMAQNQNISFNVRIPGEESQNLSYYFDSNYF